MTGTLPVEIAGVTVVPHGVSGEIASYGLEDPFAVPEDLGALVRIFVRNVSEDRDIRADVLFNGRTGLDLVGTGVLSWCDVPDSREALGKVSDGLPRGTLDCWTLNILDPGFYRNGIAIAMTDRKTGEQAQGTIRVAEADVTVERIVFASEAGDRIPDGFLVFLRNRSASPVSLGRITLWPSYGTYREHWWRETAAPRSVVPFGGEAGIPPGDMGGARVSTGPLPFGEMVLSFEILGPDGSRDIYQSIKPVVTEFDLSMGWGTEALVGSEAFRKTIRSLHVNTFHGGPGAFYDDPDRVAAHPMKTFDSLPDIAVKSSPEWLPLVHGSERFGEPQFDNRPAQGIADIYLAEYRESGYPTTLTLSHEPGFHRYAGLTDLPHFDAYRVVAPHADRWGAYVRYGSKNVPWGAPLETIGFYMRTLAALSRPNPIAAWSQALSDGWFSLLRPASGNPNPLEIRIQAYEALANGAVSLYWFNLSGKNVSANRDRLAVLQEIGREIRTVDRLLGQSAPYAWENRFLDLDQNVLAGEDHAVLFAIDLQYRKAWYNEFVSAGPRTGELSFPVPAWLRDCDAAVRVHRDGIGPIPVRMEAGRAVLSDTFQDTALYVLYRSADGDLAGELANRYDDLRRFEAAFGFDPIRNDADFALLEAEVAALP